MTDWNRLVEKLIADTPKMSQRKLCRLTGINRNTFLSFLKGGTIYIEHLEAILSVFNLELDAVSHTSKDRQCRSKRLRFVRAGTPSRQVNDVPAKSSATASARPIMTVSVQRLVSAVTRQSGIKPAPASSQVTGHV